MGEGVWGHCLVIWASGRKDKQRALGALSAPRRCMGAMQVLCLASQGSEAGCGCLHADELGECAPVSKEYSHSRAGFKCCQGATGKVRWQWCSDHGVDALVRSLLS